MKKIIAFLFVAFFNKTFGQQNLFNIPSGDITKEGEIFYQHQFNVYPEKLESKGHFVYGIGNGWDAGINLVGKGIYFSEEWRLAYNNNSKFGSLYPNLMGTIQKQFKINNTFDFNIGTQIGINLSTELENKELNNFNYAIFTKHIGKGSRIVVGGYHGNKMFLGTGNDTGILLGYELKLNKRWYLMGDWISGNNNEGAAVVGGMYNLSKRVQLCAGWLLPNENNPKDQGIVLEVNILTWDLL
jgi:hypothetical protein